MCTLYYELNCIGILLANVYILLYVKCQFVPICLLKFSCPSFFHTILDICLFAGHPVYSVCFYHCPDYFIIFFFKNSSCPPPLKIKWSLPKFMGTISCHSNQTSYSTGTKKKIRTTYRCYICVIWIELASWLQRISRLKMLTTDDGLTTDTSIYDKLTY